MLFALTQPALRHPEAMDRDIGYHTKDDKQAGREQAPRDVISTGTNNQVKEFTIFKNGGYDPGIQEPIRNAQPNPRVGELSVHMTGNFREHTCESIEARSVVRLRRG